MGEGPEGLCPVFVCQRTTLHRQIRLEEQAHAACQRTPPLARPRTLASSANSQKTAAKVASPSCSARLPFRFGDGDGERSSSRFLGGVLRVRGAMGSQARAQLLTAGVRTCAARMPAPQVTMSASPADATKALPLFPWLGRILQNRGQSRTNRFGIAPPPPRPNRAAAASRRSS